VNTIVKELSKPSVHLNGTSREELVEQNMNALHAVNTAAEILRKATPNARDYYVQSPTAFSVAVDQHRERLVSLATIATELTTIIEGLIEN